MMTPTRNEFTTFWERSADTWIRVHSEIRILMLDHFWLRFKGSGALGVGGGMLSDCSLVLLCKFVLCVLLV